MEKSVDIKHEIKLFIIDILKQKNLILDINNDTKLYSSGLLSSLNILDLLLRLEKQGLKVSHIKSNSIDSINELYDNLIF